MENGHKHDYIIVPLNMVIFPSYVSLPEGMWNNFSWTSWILESVYSWKWLETVGYGWNQVPIPSGVIRLENRLKWRFQDRKITDKSDQWSIFQQSMFDYQRVLEPISYKTYWRLTSCWNPLETDYLGDRCPLGQNREKPRSSSPSSPKESWLMLRSW